MPSRISEIRRRKLASYGERLGLELWPGADHDAPLGDFEYGTCLSLIAARAGPELPLLIGSQRRLRDLGPLGHVIMSCGALARAYDIWVRHADMIGEPVKLSSTVNPQLDPPEWRLSFEPLPFLAPSVGRMCVDELCAAFFSFAVEVTGRDFHDFRVELPYPRVEGLDYARFFPCPVTFDAPVATIIGPAAAMGAPTASGDLVALQALLEALQKRGTELHAPLGGETAARLRHFFMSHLGERPSLTVAAAALGLSVRTLNRRLHDEGTTFGDVLAGFREDYARMLLEDGTLCAKQIAHVLGYQNENCLRRAFVQWTGTSMRRWQRDQALRRAAPSIS